jgi:hypothetical protein
MHTWHFLDGRLVITVLDAWKWMRVDPRIFYSPVLALRSSETANVKKYWRCLFSPYGDRRSGPDMDPQLLPEAHLNGRC